MICQDIYTLRRFSGWVRARRRVLLMTVMAGIGRLTDVQRLGIHQYVFRRHARRMASVALSNIRLGEDAENMTIMP